MIRYLAEEEKPMCRELWEEAFPEDSKEFGDYYFGEKVKGNRILALAGEGGNAADCRIDAMVHLNPYRLMVRELSWEVDYLVGVATRREKRHRGYMRRLLLRMMEDMHQEQAPFCFLMPADEAIYLPFGFTYIFRQPRFSLGGGWEPDVQDVAAGAGGMSYGERLAALARWMEEWLGRRYQVYARRDEAYLRRLVDELASEGGTLEILSDGGAIAGAMAWWGREKREQRLLYGDRPYVDEAETPGKPAVMARIISPEAFMAAIRLKKGAGKKCVIPLRIRDPLISANDGEWLWHLGEETSWLERGGKGEGMLPGLDLTVAQLTSWMFGYEVPEAAKPYDGLVDTLQGVFLDEVV